MTIDRINPRTLPDTTSFGYSQITTSGPGKHVFVSGQVAWNPQGGPIPEDIREQAKLAMQNVVHALDAVGATVKHITAMRQYIVSTDPKDFHAVFMAIKPLFGETITCMTGLGIAALGDPSLKVELEVTAVIPHQ